MTTLGSADEAEALARAVVDQRLGACVQLQRIRSHYVYNGKPHADDEMLLLVKTKRALYDRLAKYIARHHPYETPEIIELPILRGAASYLAWIEDSTLPG